MKKLSANEVANLTFKGSKLKTSPAEPIYREIGLLSKNESLLITVDEWPLKTQPRPSCVPKRFRLSQAQYNCRKLADESGWVVTRTN